MAFFDNKRKFFHDLDKGISGTFVKFEEHTTERGKKFPVYIPLNSLKKIKYAHAIRESDVYPVFPAHDAPGCEKEILYVYRGDDPESLIGFMQNSDALKVKELKEKITVMETDLRTSKHQSMQAQAGIATTMRQVKEMHKQEKDDNKLKLNIDRFGQL